MAAESQMMNQLYQDHHQILWNSSSLLQVTKRSCICCCTVCNCPSFKLPNMAMTSFFVRARCLSAGLRSWVLLADQRGIEPPPAVCQRRQERRDTNWATRMTNMAMTSWICAVWGVKPSKSRSNWTTRHVSLVFIGFTPKFGKLPDLGPPGVLAPPKLGHALVQSAAQTFCWGIHYALTSPINVKQNSFFRSQKMNSTIFFRFLRALRPRKLKWKIWKICWFSSHSTNQILTVFSVRHLQ